VHYAPGRQQSVIGVDTLIAYFLRPHARYFNSLKADDFVANCEWRQRTHADTDERLKFGADEDGAIA
jgi:hypothetical protein